MAKSTFKKAGELSDRARKELNKEGQRHWMAYVYGYMMSCMNDTAIKHFEEHLELTKRAYPKKKNSDG